jgi:hypothetical protein
MRAALVPALHDPACKLDRSGLRFPEVTRRIDWTIAMREDQMRASGLSGGVETAGHRHAWMNVVSEPCTKTLCIYSYIFLPWPR